jgi:hypothetical protein
LLREQRLKGIDGSLKIISHEAANALQISRLQMIGVQGKNLTKVPGRLFELSLVEICQA